MPYPSADAVLERIRSRLPANTLAVLDAAEKLVAADALYLVGGIVRDALLDTGTRAESAEPYTRDLDLLVEGGGGAALLGRALQRALGGSLTCHDAFLTCTLSLEGLEVDLATARAEHYPHPGALPQVRAATLGDDLRRRDFSVNTPALRLAPRPPHLFGVPGALSDLRGGRLRTLHPASFADDPTRMVRGSRLAGRLGFDYDEETERRLREALGAGFHTQVSPARWQHELRLTLAEPQVAPAVAHLARQGALECLYGLRTTPVLSQLDALRQTSTVGATVPDESYLLALLSTLEGQELTAHLRRFSLPKRLLGSQRRLGRALRGEALEPLERGAEAEQVVLKVVRPELAAQLERPLLRAEDVLDLGLPAGPKVGEVLRAVSRARASGTLASLESERRFAERLVAELADREVTGKE